MSEQAEPYRCAIAVLVEVPADSAAGQRDADRCAELALRQKLAGAALGPMPAEIQLSIRDTGPIPMAVVDVTEVGMAAGNGYQRTRPTAKAFRERGR